MTLFAQGLYANDAAGVTASPSSPHIDFWDVSPDFDASVANMRAMNSGTKVLMYSSLAWTRSTSSVAVADSLAIDWATANAHESWFLHKTTTGNPRAGPDSYGNYILNPRGAAWNQPMDNAVADAAASFMLSAFHKNTYDGIFFDGVVTNVLQNFGATVECPNDTTTSWPTAWIQYMLIPYCQRLFSQLRAGGVARIIANPGLNYGYAAYIDTDGAHRASKNLINDCGFDGIMEESWIDAAAPGPEQQQGPTWGGTGNQRWFDGKYNTGKWVAAQGKWMWNHTKGSSGEQSARYALGMGMMQANADPGSAANRILHLTNFNQWTRANVSWYPEYGQVMQLGAPSGPPSGPRADGTYFRSFANGTVTVNPTSTAQLGIPAWDAQITLSAPQNSAPVNTSAPTISGQPQVGATLACNDGAWSGSPTPTLARQWKRNGAGIAGATGQTYIVQSADIGTTITVTVTATNSVGSASATSPGLVIPTVASSAIVDYRRMGVDSNNKLHPTELPAESPSRLVLLGDLAAISAQTTLQDIAGLQPALGASNTEIWDLTWMLIMSAANATMDLKLGLVLPAGATAKWGPVGGGTVSGWDAVAAASSPGNLLTETGVLTLGTPAGGTFGTMLRAIVFGAGTPGSTRLQYAQATSDAGALQILKGSFATFTRLHV